MRIPTRRKGLSQSTDILLILTATLAVGGIMYGVATGLIGGMGHISSLQVASSGINVGTSSTTVTISLKNSGNTILTGTASVTVSGLSSISAQTITATGGDTHGDTVTATATVTASQLAATFTTGSITLNPGDVVSLTFYTTNGFTAGNSYAINGVVGSETFSTSVAATSA